MNRNITIMQLFYICLPVVYLQTQLYTLEVRANDGGDPVMSNTVIVYFNVKDTNDKPPLFEHGTYNSAIYENVTIGTSVVEVKATDVDSGENWLLWLSRS